MVPAARQSAFVRSLGGSGDAEGNYGRSPMDRLRRGQHLRAVPSNARRLRADLPSSLVLRSESHSGGNVPKNRCETGATCPSGRFQPPASPSQGASDGTIILFVGLRPCCWLRAPPRSGCGNIRGTCCLRLPNCELYGRKSPPASTGQLYSTMLEKPRADSSRCFEERGLLGTSGMKRCQPRSFASAPTWATRTVS